MNIWKWLTTSKPNNLLAIIIAIITAAGSYFGSTLSSNKNIDSLRIETNQKIQTISSQSQTQSLNIPKEVLSGTTEEKSTKEKNGNGFNPDGWVFTNETSPNKEGYYCPANIGFPSWFMWSKNKYKADSQVSISFSLLDKTSDDKNPTLYFSYGDKTSDAPDTFYRINIFDGDLNTIRTYDRDSKEVQFERSINKAPLDRFITFKIAPVFPNKKSSILILNPTISYQLDGKKYDFDPKKEFKINLPLSSGDEQGDGFQYGIGISEEDCFKIISSSL